MKHDIDLIRQAEQAHRARRREELRGDLRALELGLVLGALAVAILSAIRFWPDLAAFAAAGGL